MDIRILAIAASLWLAATACTAEAGTSLPPLRLHYVSAFAGYPSHPDPKPVEWPSSNALVGELQGHAGHLRAAAADSRPAPQSPQRDGARP